MIDHDKQLIFLHPPKCGGTSIEIAIQPHRLNDKKILKKNKHTNANYYRNTYRECWESYTKIAIVRNPFSRIVSLFNFFKYDVIKPDVAKCETLTDFLDLIFVEKKFRCEGFESVEFGMKKFLTAGGKYSIDICMKLETILDDYKKIQDRFNLSDELPHYNGQFKVSKQRSVNYREMYTPEDIARVKGIYKDDLEFYKYSFEPLVENK